ncbi:hypothetical protein HK104_009685 [Borealophlyctis nickersoniae]|nr:hypothetical protein HK104_009685 [Borealophlyctis nickersoniae]
MEDSAQKYASWSREDLIAQILQYESNTHNHQAAAITDAVAHQPDSFPRPSAASPTTHIAKRTRTEGSKQKQPRSARNARPFDFSQHAARSIALKIAYLGWYYYGLAGTDSDTVETIESVLFRALITARLVPDRPSCAWSRSGRTDKGVSAFGQVVGLKIRSALPKGQEGTVNWGPKPHSARVKNGDAMDIEDGEGEPDEDEDMKAVDGMGSAADASGSDNDNAAKSAFPVNSTSKSELPYLSILNRILPPEIRVLAWSPVPEDFDARFDCTYRRYKYFFSADGLNIQAMREAARRLLGLHDFRNFCKIDTAKNLQSFLRTVTSAYIAPLGQEDKEDAEDIQHDEAAISADTFYVFVIQGKAFLWHQVRCIVAILFLVGRGLESPTIVTDLLDMSKHPDNVGRPQYEMASEIPLVLVECGYPPNLLSWRTCDDNLEDGPPSEVKLVARLRDTWRHHATKAAQIRSLIGDTEAMVEGGVDAVQVANIVNAVTGDGTGKDKKYVKVMERQRCDSMEERKKKAEETQARKVLVREKKEKGKWVRMQDVKARQ